MPKIIEVIPNPYIALDKDGVPQGVVGAGMPGIFIGAQLDLVATRLTGKNRFYFPLDRDGKMAKKVHHSSDIVTAVQAGELIAANKESALACGLTDKEYLEPEKALAAEKAKALAYYQALKGGAKPDPTAKVADIPREPTPEDPAEPLPVEKVSKELSPNLKMTKTEA